MLQSQYRKTSTIEKRDETILPLRYGHPDLDYINLYRARTSDVASLLALGVPREKVQPRSMFSNF